jgi:hypothetical protein
MIASRTQSFEAEEEVMILVRTTIQGKFGAGGAIATELATSTKEIGEGIPGAKSFRILTDLSGGFDRAILEVVTDSLASWEQARAAIFAHPKFQQAMAATYEMAAGGSTEFFTIEAEW